MKIEFNENLCIDQKFTAFELDRLDVINHFDMMYDSEYNEYKYFGYNPTTIYIQGKGYKAIPIYKMSRMKNESDGYYRFIYIQININNGEYYIGKVNRKKWKEVERYQGSGLLFTSKYKKYKEEFVRYYIASCSSKKECEQLEHEIVNAELLKDEKCLNLVVGGGGTADHFDETRKEKISAYMKSHPEAFQSMIMEAKRLYTDKDSFALKQRAKSIKATMSDEKYRKMMSERIKNWRINNPEEYKKARENNRISINSKESKEKKKKAIENWRINNPEANKERLRKSAEGNRTKEARKKHSNSLKEWAKNNPEKAKENTRKRSEASVKVCSKKVAMKDLVTNEVVQVFSSQHDAARWLVKNGYAKNIKCVSSINAVCQKKPCTTGYGFRKKAHGFKWDYVID